MTEHEGIQFNSEDPTTSFKVLETIGHGSFGYVYKATVVGSKDVVAIKKVPQVKKKKEEWRDIKREIEFMRGCNDEHLVAIRGAYFRSGMVWIVMDYCVGSASDLLAVVPGALEETEIVGVVFQALLGLRYIHTKGCIHRDIKCSNILITNDGVVKLADFGSASTKAKDVNSFVGTPYWMAPELITAMEEGTYDNKVDIWSLGISTLELAHKQVPLLQMNAMSALYHIPDSPSPALENPELWSDDLNTFVTGCLEKAGANRPDADTLLSTQKLFAGVEAHQTATVLSGLLMRIEKAHDMHNQLLQASGDSAADESSNHGGGEIRSYKCHAPMVQSTPSNEPPMAESPLLLRANQNGEKGKLCSSARTPTPPEAYASTQRPSHEVVVHPPTDSPFESTTTIEGASSGRSTPFHTTSTGESSVLALYGDPQENRSQPQPRKSADVTAGMSAALKSARIHNSKTTHPQSRDSWKGHQYDAKMMQKTNQRKKKELTRSHDKMLQDLNAQHFQLKNRLTIEQEQKIVKLAQQHQLELERLDRRDVSEQQSFAAKIAFEEKAAWKAFEKQSKLTKISIKLEGKQNKGASKKETKGRYTREVLSMKEDLERMQQKNKEEEYTQLKEEMRRRRSICNVAHVKEVLQIEQQHLIERCEFELKCALEIQNLSMKQLLERNELSLECSMRAHKMEGEWLKQHQQRDIKNMERRHHEENKEKPKLRKQLRAKMRDKRNNQARLISQDSNISCKSAQTSPMSPRTSTNPTAASVSLPVEAINSSESDRASNFYMSSGYSTNSSTFGKSPRGISKDKKREVAGRMAQLEATIQVEYNEKVAELEKEMENKHKNEARALAEQHAREEAVWKEAAQKKTTDLERAMSAAQQGLRDAQAEETRFIKEQHKARIAQLRINEREQIERNTVQ